MRVLGLDIGDKRIGIALSDPMGIIAGALETYTRTRLAEDIAHIGSLCAESGVSRIVCGLPLHMNGLEGEQARKTREFVEVLRAALELPVHFIDERGTTKRARDALIEGNMRRNRRKQTIDKVAAVIILQDYLDGGGVNHGK